MATSTPSSRSSRTGSRSTPSTPTQARTSGAPATCRETRSSSSAWSPMSGTTSCGSTPYGPDVYFLVLPGTMLLDFAGTSETLRVAADFGAPFRIHYVGPADLPRTSLGLTLGGVEPLPAGLPPGAIVIIPGVEKSARDSP